MTNLTVVHWAFLNILICFKVNANGPVISKSVTLYCIQSVRIVKVLMS